MFNYNESFVFIDGFVFGESDDVVDVVFVFGVVCVVFFGWFDLF